MSYTTTSTGTGTIGTIFNPSPNTITTSDYIVTGPTSTSTIPYSYSTSCGQPITIKYPSNTTEKENKEKEIMFKKVEEIVPEKVYRFTFNDGKIIKTVRSDLDIFDLEYTFYLALAKKLYAPTFTFEGVINKSYELQYEKKYKKIVKQGIKLLKEYQENKAKKEEEKAIKERRHKKLVEKKKAARKRKRENEINLIAEAIRRSKEEA